MAEPAQEAVLEELTALKKLMMLQLLAIGYKQKDLLPHWE
jgi:hypothetical protein